MPRTKQHSERGNAAALQQRVESAEAEATALRRQCKMLGTHVWLLQRELSQAERETQAMHAASSRMKPGARRRTRQNTTDTVGLNGLRIPSASGLSTSVTPEMLRPSCSTPDLTSLGERRPSISSSQGGRVSSAASSESLAPSPDVSPEKMRRPRSPMKTTELRRDTPSSSAGTPPPPLVQLARDGSGGGGAKPPAAPQRPQALVPQATAAAQQGSASSPSVSPQLLSLSVPMPVGAPGSELFDRPHSGDSPLLRGARSAGELSSLAAGLGSGPGAGSPLGAAHDASVARPSKLAVGSLQEYGCSTLQEASASASSTAAELDVCHTGLQPRTSRPQAGLLLTRLSLASDRPWTVEDLSPGALEPFAASKVFLGGDAGRDTMVMVHGEDMLPGAEEIGNGAYKGGVNSAVQAVAAGALPADRFKFFYKSVEFLPDALALQINSGVFRMPLRARTLE